MAKEIAEGADFEAAKPHSLPNALRTRVPPLDVATSLTDKIDIVQPERL